MLPALFAFVLSFTVIAAFWVGHYRTFRYVVDADGRLVAINFAFLFCIAILPFPTSIIARQGDLPSATIIYAAFGVATGALSTLLWIYPSQIANLALPTVTPSIARYVTYRAAVIPIVFALSIPVALVAPTLAWVMWFAAAPIQALVTRRYKLTQRFARPASRGSAALAAEQPAEDVPMSEDPQPVPPVRPPSKTPMSGIPPAAPLRPPDGTLPPGVSMFTICGRNARASAGAGRCRCGQLDHCWTVSGPSA